MIKDKYNATKQLLDFTKKFWCVYIPIILTVFVIAIITLLVFDIQKQVYIGSEQYCNNLYGYGQWYWKETTGKKLCEYYIGQCWECFPKGELNVP